MERSYNYPQHIADWKKPDTKVCIVWFQLHKMQAQPPPHVLEVGKELPHSKETRHWLKRHTRGSVLVLGPVSWVHVDLEQIYEVTTYELDIFLFMYFPFLKSLV